MQAGNVCIPGYRGQIHRSNRHGGSAVYPALGGEQRFSGDHCAAEKLRHRDHVLCSENAVNHVKPGAGSGW